MEVQRFDCVLKRQDVILVIDGEDKKYYLQMMTGKKRDAYLGTMKDKVNIDTTDPTAPKTTITSFDGLQSSLLCQTLFAGDDVLATSEFIDELPANVQVSLFDIASKLNGIGKKGEEEAKKD